MDAVKFKTRQSHICTHLLLVVGLLQVAGADGLRGAAAAGALLHLLHLLPGLGLLELPGLLSPFLHLLYLPRLSDLRPRRGPDISPPLPHQSLGRRAQHPGGGGALRLDPLDVVHGVRPLLELAGILARAGFFARVLLGGFGRRLVRLQLALVAHGGGAADDENHDDEERGHDNDDEQVLLEEVHHSAQDVVFEPDHGGGDAVGGVGSSGCSGDQVSGQPSGEGRGEEELRLGFIAAAVHGQVEERTGSTRSAQQAHAGEQRHQGGAHLHLEGQQQQG